MKKKVSKKDIIAMRTGQVSFPNENKNWSKKDDEELLKMYYEGIDMTTIAAHFGRSENSVNQRLQKLGCYEIICNHRDKGMRIKKCKCSDCSLKGTQECKLCKLMCQ